jgi:hypothetical protein
MDWCLAADICPRGAGRQAHCDGVDCCGCWRRAQWPGEAHGARECALLGPWMHQRRPQLAMVVQVQHLVVVARAPGVDKALNQDGAVKAITTTLASGTAFFYRSTVRLGLGLGTAWAGGCVPDAPSPCWPLPACACRAHLCVPGGGRLSAARATRAVQRAVAGLRAGAGGATEHDSNIRTEET